jgi:hypothetical protein
MAMFNMAARPMTTTTPYQNRLAYEFAMTCKSVSSRRSIKKSICTVALDMSRPAVERGPDASVVLEAAAVGIVMPGMLEVMLDISIDSIANSLLRLLRTRIYCNETEKVVRMERIGKGQ